MTMPDEKAEQEARRERMWDPKRRWQAIQETITWAEAQLAEPRNSRANRLREQAEKLAGGRTPGSIAE